MDNGTVEIIDVQRNAVVGYGFTEDGTTPDAQKVQRWVLYADYTAPPVGAAVFRQPSDPARRYTRLEEWTRALQDGSLWKEGAKYVKAKCVAYDTIVDYPLRPYQQLDDGASTLSQGDVAAGAVFTTTVPDVGTFEHWVLYTSYVSPPGAALLVGPPRASDAVPTLSDFLARMSAAWQSGYTYAVCACSSFSSLPTSL